jgi:uncharacterized cupredoxin-like copper-binding protein
MLKFFGIVGLVGVSVTAYLVTAGVGPERQLPPEVSLLEGFREEGYMPKSLNLVIDETAEEAEVFEVPEMDEVVLEAALENMGDMNMAGMDMSGSSESMSGMDMSKADDTTSMEGMNMAGNDSSESAGMDMSGEGATTMSGMDMSNAQDSSTMEGMNIPEGGNTEMADMDMSGADEPVLDMDMDGDGVMDMSSADMANMDGMNMSGNDSTQMTGMDMSPSNAAMMGEGGILISEDGNFDREIELTMREWGFSDMQIDVKKGERIKFTVKNGGQIPHEFMFMSAPLMAAANYRATRADWNLFEHEALFEQALVLPGGDFSFVLQVQEPGSWMFMCMLPYHMQMGMMGQMATEGMAMQMDM